MHDNNEESQMPSDSQIMKLLEEAWSRRREGKYKDIRALLVKARGLCEHGDYDFLARVLHISMQIDYDQGNLSSALEQCQQSLALYRKAKNSDKIAPR